MMNIAPPRVKRIGIEHLKPKLSESTIKGLSKSGRSSLKERGLDPFAFTEDPKYKEAAARAKALLTQSKKLSKKENKKTKAKSVDSDEDIMAF